MEMMSDRMLKITDLDKPYSVNIVDREEWAESEPDYMKKGLTWYTDGSKRSTGTGAGIFGVRPKVRFSISLGKLATVFQAEIIALSECARTCVSRGFKGHTIHISSDSKAALMALAGHDFTSKAVWECHTAMKQLAKTNSVKLLWVPSHRGVAGNERADRWANKGAVNPLIGPEPAPGVAYGFVRNAVRQWVLRAGAL